MTQTLLIDSATPLDPRDIKAAGYIGVLRYIAPPDAKYDWKRLTIPERDGYWEQGLGILPIFESYATRAKEGAAAGATDANTYLWELHQLGWPGGLPMLMADDTDTFADQVRPYFQAAAQVTSDAGIYGGVHAVDPLLEDGTVKWGWQACAWSGQVVSRLAHLYQRRVPTTSLSLKYHSGEFDEDVQLKPIPLWLPESAPAPAPVQQNPQPVGGFDVASLPVLRQGTSGQPVKNMQGLLVAHGHPIAVDGAFGPNTAQALRAFQSNARIGVDAICGPQTWGALLS